jgi:hypothetical protein
MATEQDSPDTLRGGGLQTLWPHVMSRSPRASGPRLLDTLPYFFVPSLRELSNPCGSITKVSTAAVPPTPLGVRPPA